MTTYNTTASWTSAWPDALAFALGLGIAWLSGWTTTDLVWSLWFSSLVVGYATIIWMIVRPGVRIARGVWRDRAFIGQLTHPQKAGALAGSVTLLVVGLFMLAFFTVHFGGFHYVHSQFLIGFFPLDTGDAARPGTADLSTYLEVATRYWLFLPSAFLAERAGFLREPQPAEDDLSVAAPAIAARMAANARSGSKMLAPYRNVVRMHGLIFFFAFAHFTGLDQFVVYAVVYAAYFFPWRVLSGGARDARGAQGAQG